MRRLDPGNHLQCDAVHSQEASLLQSLAPRERRVTQYVIEGLRGAPEARALVLGGSATIEPRCDSWGDVDLWLVTASEAAAKRYVSALLECAPEVCFVHDAGYFPWFGEVLTATYFPDLSLSIDVGVCGFKDFAGANPGPRPQVLWGDPDLLKQLPERRHAAAAGEMLAQMAMNLLKLRRGIARGQYWNALEYLARARRQYFALLIDYTDSTRVYYSREERDIERRISGPQLAASLATHPREVTSIAIQAAAGALARLAMARADVLSAQGPWHAVLLQVACWQ